MNKFSVKALAITGVLSALFGSAATIGGAVALSTQGYAIANTDSYRVTAKINGEPLSIQCDTVRLTNALNQVLIIRGFGNRNNTGYGANAMVEYFTTPENEALLYDLATAGYVSFRGHSNPSPDTGKEVRDACILSHSDLAQHMVQPM